MNSKMTTNSQLSTTKPKKKKQKQKKPLSKQLGQDQIHRNRDYVEGYQLGGGVGPGQRGKRYRE